MISAPLQPLPWPRRRWWLLITIIFTIQLALIFILSERKTPVIRKAPTGFALQFVAETTEWLALSDPTRFALPQADSFGGPFWLQSPRYTNGPERWTEPVQWLALPAEQLGDTFTKFMLSNTFAGVEIITKAPPQLTLPQPLPETETSRSTLRIEGDLARRQLLKPVEPPAMPAEELLSSSAVRVLVDSSGKIVSAILTGQRSGSADADQEALRLARSARFEAGPGGDSTIGLPGSQMTLGEMIFRWQTIALPATNGSPAPKE